MAENVKSVRWHQQKTKTVVKHGGAGGFWFMGFVGALFYYLHVHSGTFWLVILAVVKAVVWPALLVYHLLVFLQM